MSKDPIHPRNKLRKYVGNLEIYFETGMECLGTILHEDRGLHEGDHWDVKNHPGEKFMYHSLEWSFWFTNRVGVYNVKIFNKRGRVVYEGPLTKDKAKIASENYRYDYLPKELTTATWISYCNKGYRVELHTNEIPMAQQKEYNIDFNIGEMVYDDLTGKDEVILNITLGEGKGKTVGYWLSGDYLEGGRHPWEISKIDLLKRWKEHKEKDKNENQDG